MNHLSITYIPRHTNKQRTYSYSLDKNTIYLRQDFLDDVEEEFLQIMLSDAMGELVPDRVIDIVLAYSDQRELDKDVTVVFTY
jgi:hypothetical protein